MTSNKRKNASFPKRTKSPTGRHHFLQATHVDRGQQRRREDGEQEKGKEERKKGKGERKTGKGERKTGKGERKKKGRSESEETNQVSVAFAFLLTFDLAKSFFKNLKQKTTDNHRVPQAGHDGRAPSQHTLGPVVHPRPKGEKKLKEKRGEKRPVLLSFFIRSHKAKKCFFF